LIKRDLISGSQMKWKFKNGRRYLFKIWNKFAALENSDDNATIKGA
jgi:hypothetical protein